MNYELIPIFDEFIYFFHLSSLFFSNSIWNWWDDNKLFFHQLYTNTHTIGNGVSDIKNIEFVVSVTNHKNSIFFSPDCKIVVTFYSKNTHKNSKKTSFFSSSRMKENFSTETKKNFVWICNSISEIECHKNEFNEFWKWEYYVAAIETAMTNRTSKEVSLRATLGTTCVWIFMSCILQEPFVALFPLSFVCITYYRRIGRSAHMISWKHLDKCIEM